MNEAALDELIATIDELERLFAQARDNALSPAWQEMQVKLNDVQEQITRLRPH